MGAKMGKWGPMGGGNDFFSKMELMCLGTFTLHGCGLNSFAKYEFPHTSIFYLAALKRLIEALHWLSYPKHVI